MQRLALGVDLALPGGVGQALAPHMIVVIVGLRVSDGNHQAHVQRFIRVDQPSATRLLITPFARALPILWYELLASAPPLHDGISVPVLVQVGVLDEDDLQSRCDYLDRFED